MRLDGAQDLLIVDALVRVRYFQFWSSADLTGNQTGEFEPTKRLRFWSSADLTGNQTMVLVLSSFDLFWSSADLTGNQT